MGVRVLILPDGFREGDVAGVEIELGFGGGAEDFGCGDRRIRLPISRRRRWQNCCRGRRCFRSGPSFQRLEAFGAGDVCGGGEVAVTSEVRGRRRK